MTKFLWFTVFQFFFCLSLINSDEGNSSNTVDIQRVQGNVINQNYAQITVKSNMPQARWTMQRYNKTVYAGIGSIVNYQIPAGENYRLIPEEIEGYSVKTSQPTDFDLYGGQTTQITISYERAYGTLNLQAPFPSGLPVKVMIKAPNVPSVFVELRSRDGRIFWHSKPIPTGTYEISYELPQNFAPVVPQQFIIHEGRQTELTPQLFVNGTLHVKANIADAIYILHGQRSSQVWEGEGQEYLFNELPPGRYMLSFSAKQPDYYILPPPLHIVLGELEKKELTVHFHVAAKLNISTNVEGSHVSIQEMGGLQNVYQGVTSSGSLSFVLPEGHYRVTLTAPTTESQAVMANAAPKPVDVTLKAFNTVNLNLNFNQNNEHAKEENVENQGKVNIITNVSTGGFSVFKNSYGTHELIGHYSGKSSLLTLSTEESYEVTFDDVPNYKTPKSIQITPKSNKENVVQATYTALQNTVDIPAGQSLLGTANPVDANNELPLKTVNLKAFAIGTYEVTNAQYVVWLNQALNENKIVYIQEADRQGQVIDMDGHLIFKTFEADPFSQISVQQQSNNHPLFMTIAGKDLFPVINVSWRGAVAYCNDNNCRLPTEAEWEKAAGMAPGITGEKLIKYIYGFGKNEIDSTWANYKDNEISNPRFQVTTTPVGFYNGTNYLPLSLQHPDQQKTHLAKSPYGAFDMSGNVWEWVSDWYASDYSADMVDTDPQGPPSGTKKVVKGGCYDSLRDGVRVTERLGLPLEYCDAYTGFRIVIDK